MTTGRINQIATSGSGAPPVREEGRGHRGPQTGGREPHGLPPHKSFFQFLALFSKKTSTATRLPESTHTKCVRGESAPLLFLTLQPCLSNIQQRSEGWNNSATLRGGGVLRWASSERGKRGYSALHEPRCGSSTSAGAGTRSLCMWLHTNKRTGQQDYQCQTLSPSAVTPSQEPRGPLVSRVMSRHGREHAARVLEPERTVVNLAGGYEPRSWVASRCSFP